MFQERMADVSPVQFRSTLSLSATAEPTASPLRSPPSSGTFGMPGDIGKWVLVLHGSSSAELKSTRKCCLDSARPMSQSDFCRDASVMEVLRLDDVPERLGNKKRVWQPKIWERRQMCGALRIRFLKFRGEV